MPEIQITPIHHYVMQIGNTVPDVASRIETLYSILKKTDDIPTLVKKINDILLYGDKISINLVSGGWDFFAKRKKVIS